MEVKTKSTDHILKVDISAGISPVKLAQLLKTYSQFLLKSKSKSIAFEGDKIVFINHQMQIDLSHIPSTIGDLRLGDFEKKILLKGDLLQLGNSAIRLDAANKQLKIEGPNGQIILKRKM